MKSWRSHGQAHALFAEVRLATSGHLAPWEPWNRMNQEWLELVCSAMRLAEKDWVCGPAAPESLVRVWLDRPECGWSVSLAGALSQWFPVAVVRWEDEGTVQVVGSSNDVDLFLAAFVVTRAWVDQAAVPGDDAALRRFYRPWDNRIERACQDLVLDIDAWISAAESPYANLHRRAWDARSKRSKAVHRAVQELWPGQTQPPQAPGGVVAGWWEGVPAEE